jgi:hypothetical protein
VEVDGRPPSFHARQEERIMNRPHYLTIGVALAAAVLIVPATLFAQGDPPPRGGAGASRPSGGGGGGNVGTAVSRGDAGGSSGSSAGSSWGSGGSSSGGSSGAYGVSDGQRRQAAPRGTSGTDGRRYGGSRDGESRVLPWYSRSRGDRPVVGTAAGREEVGRPGGGGGGYYPGYGAGHGYGYGGYGYPYSYGYGGWYGNCRTMYGFGAFGLGSFFYDPSWWSYGAYPGYGGCYPYGGGYGGGYDPYYGYGGGYYGGGGGYSRSSADAGIKLKVKPSNAQVFVDGYFAGEVDEFDGVFQRLPLTSGEHRIEIRAPGFQPLTFDVNVEPFQVINFKGELKRQ